MSQSNHEHNHVDARFPVQWVIRPHSDEYHDFRGYAGRVAGGVFKQGDEITVLPSGFQSRIKNAFFVLKRKLEQMSDFESNLYNHFNNTERKFGVINRPSRYDNDTKKYIA